MGMAVVWRGWRSALIIVKPNIVIAWHRRNFRLFRTWKVRRGQPGRPTVSEEVRQLIRKMSPRIRFGEHLAFTVNCSNSASMWAKPASASISCAIASRHSGLGEPSSRITSRLWSRWTSSGADDQFPGAVCISVLAHDRRRIVHFNVTAHPTAEWTAEQLREALPFDQAPRYLLRDRDGIFSSEFRSEVKSTGIKEVLSTPRSPWERAFVERVIGTIRRECLDHVIVFNQASLYRHVKSFLAYYHESRTHLSLAKDSPEPRPVHSAECGAVVAIPQVGGLHHRHERHAA
jgi:putative transposase